MHIYGNIMKIWKYSNVATLLHSPHDYISQIWLPCISQGWLFGLGWGVVLYSKLLRQTIVYEWIVQCAFWPRLAVHVELARDGLYYSVLLCIV